MANREPFPCFACGKCCQYIGNNPQAIYLDRGDGTCRHFDEDSKHCKIYNERPLICRVEEFYDIHLSHIYSWEDFVKLNLEACHKLNTQG